MATLITLTAIVRGYFNNNYAAPRIFPEIKVEGFPLKAKTWGKDMFKVVQTLRAKYANSNILKIDDSGEITIEHEVHDLVTEIDLEHEPTLDLNDKKIRAAKRSQEGLLLRQEVNAATRLQDLDVYPSGNKVTLSGTDQWSDLDHSNPVKDIYDGKNAVAAKVGVEPNLMVMAKDVFDVAIFHPQLAMVNPTTLQVTPATVETLKARFGVNELVVAQSLRLNETDGTFVSNWTKTVILLYVNPNPTASKEDMSFGYRFREKKYPFVDDKDIEPGKVIGIRANDKVNDVILSADAGYLITGVIA